MTTPTEPADLTADHPDVAALGPAGQRLVLDLVDELADYDLELDTKERTLLLEAARHLDVAHRLQAELDAGDVIVQGSTGQPRVSPLVESIDKARRTVAQLLGHVARGNREDQARAAAKARTRAQGRPTSASLAVAPAPKPQDRRSRLLDEGGVA